MPKLYLHNTLSHRKDEFVPSDPERVTMYVCGPTPYNFAHIGNARTFISFDLLFRVLRHLYGAAHVVYARNITDVEDKLIAAANETGQPMADIAARYTKALHEDLNALGALAPTYEPAATRNIAAIIEMIEDLVAEGAAYRAQSGVYFSVEADREYGKLSGRAQEDLRAGARIVGEEDKRAPSDFALWKGAKPGEPSWPSPWGPGRPGWHIECSAMIARQFGGTIDIHGGGADLIFPHHENEIAQSECAAHQPLARYWLHAGFLTMDAEKMSKSLGNVVLARDLLKAWPGEVVRFALMAAHYRAPLNFSEDLLKQAKASLDRLYGALERVWDAETIESEPPPAFIEALYDDLNMPKAIAELSALASAANKAETARERAHAKADLVAAGALIGVLRGEPSAWFKGAGEDGAIEALIAKRAEARRAKNWPEADRVRAELDALGVVVMDDPKGGASTWRRA